VDAIRNTATALQASEKRVATVLTAMRSAPTGAGMAGSLFDR
jgi:hypothetical protein